jgi:hypothetical protein
MVNPNTATPSSAEQVVNGAKFVADLALLPGASQIVEGKVVSGLTYGLAGLAARAFLGPLGWVATGLDSYSLSASGKHLWEHVTMPRINDTPAKSALPEGAL